MKTANYTDVEMDSLAKKFLKSNIFFIKSAMDCDPGILPESCIDFINSADKAFACCSKAQAA